MSSGHAITRRAALALSGAAVASSRGGAKNLSAEDDEFLDALSQRCFRYFWDYTDPGTGLTRGRCRADGAPYAENRRDIGSIAVTGFGLAGLCIAASRGWITHGEARARLRSALHFFTYDAPREHGWFYHWMNVKSGRRTGVLETSEKSELSSIDTALLMGGILAARGYFRHDPEIRRLATQIYERIDFQWMLNGHPLLLSHGWTPEKGFIRYRWSSYSEFTIIYLLGIGSPTHGISADSWYAWERPVNTHAGYRFIGMAPLFTHQYSHAFVDYRGRREARGGRTDWFENSAVATEAHRQFCIGLAADFPGCYSENIWGITCSNSETGYQAWGGPPRSKTINGTVVPAAPGGSLMFEPGICAAALKDMKERYGDKVYGYYGFTDAFQPVRKWASPDVLGLNVGITLVSAENARSGNVWKWFMRNPEIPKAMRRAELDRA
jgi:hypothetical protein